MFGKYGGKVLALCMVIAKNCLVKRSRSYTDTCKLCTNYTIWSYSYLIIN